MNKDMFSWFGLVRRMAKKNHEDKSGEGRPLLTFENAEKIIILEVKIVRISRKATA